MHHHHHHHHMGHEAVGDADCDADSVWDTVTTMCVPRARDDAPKTFEMLHGNLFAVATTESGPRGRNALAGPSMLMGDYGQTKSRHYFNVDLMLTVDRWTVPETGYPELLQIGENNGFGNPYVDAQHPHSSPIMGLTFSDTISFGDERDHVKFFAAPRGQSTEGPVAFMHRPTGQVNPDAPLGHHIGQDVGHISSTVLGTSLKWGTTTIEASAFHGTEPSPLNVDLPLGTPDSYAIRLIEEFPAHLLGMASWAHIFKPEPQDTNTVIEDRYSASLYYSVPVGEDWKFFDTLIYGAVSSYDNASTLTSFADELLFEGPEHLWFGRIETLQRTPAELSISTNGDPNVGLWVTALTAGYSYKALTTSAGDLFVGASLTNDLLPDAYVGAYGGNPWTFRLFIRLAPMFMPD